MSYAMRVARVRRPMRHGHAGDPFLHKSIGKALGGVARTAVSFLPGGNLIGGAIDAVRGGGGGHAAPFAAPPPAMPGGGQDFGSQLVARLKGGGGLIGSITDPLGLGPGGAFGGGGGTFQSLNGGPPPAGYRYNKTSYFLRDGTFVPAGTKIVKIRRRNPLNPRALDRAMGRLTSAKRAAKKIGRISIRKKC